MSTKLNSILLLLLLIPSNYLSFNINSDNFKEYPPNLVQDIKQYFKMMNTSPDQMETRRLNWFFDNQFRYVKYYGHYVIPIPNIITRFKHNIEDTVYTGDIFLTSGLMTNLDLRRKCNATVLYEYPLATIEVLVGFDNFEYLFHYKSDFMNTVTKGGLRGRIKDMTCLLVFTLDVVDMNLKIKRFGIQTFGEILLITEGESKWMSAVVRNVTEPLINSQIRPILTKYVKNVTHSLVNWYNSIIVNYYIKQ